MQKISIKREQSQAGLSFAERENRRSAAGGKAKFRPQVKNKLLLLLALLMTACSEDMVDEATSNVSREANALLQVTTRGTNDATVAYPVQVYVFQGNDCKAVQTIGDEGQTLNIPLVEPMGMDSAQVTAGGILTADFDEETMESRLVPGLFACGEVLDIDGDCGGYNLQWAWSSGRCAGTAAGKE